ncbi:MAG: TolB family protein [Acidimicrobiales bacterium]
MLCGVGVLLSQALPAAAAEAAYPRVGIRLLTEGNVQDWSPDGQSLVMSKQSSAGVWETFLIRPDGSVIKNLNTQVRPGDPPANCDRGNAHFHPSGKYLVMQVGEREAGCPNVYADPGSGAWTNLWAYELSTGKWTKLTKYSYLPSFKIYGTLFPNFSRDGSKLVWSKLLAPGDATNVFGRWEMHVATFSLVGGPHLESDKSYRPGAASFYEPFGFTAGDTEILFSANIGYPTPAETLASTDLWLYNPQNDALTNWTASPNEYDEHARISPDGRRVVWGSSGDVRIQRIDKADARQRVTFFNTCCFEEFQWGTWGWAMAWSPNGKQVVVTQQFPGNESKNRSWIVTLDA